MTQLVLHHDSNCQLSFFKAIIQNNAFAAGSAAGSQTPHVSTKSTASLIIIGSHFNEREYLCDGMNVKCRCHIITSATWITDN